MEVALTEKLTLSCLIDTLCVQKEVNRERNFRLQLQDNVQIVITLEQVLAPCGLWTVSTIGAASQNITVLTATTRKEKRLRLSCVKIMKQTYILMLSWAYRQWRAP